TLPDSRRLQNGFRRTRRPNPRGENRRPKRLCRHSIDRRVRSFRLYRWTLPLKDSENSFLSKTQFYKIPVNSRRISFAFSMGKRSFGVGGVRPSSFFYGWYIVGVGILVNIAGTFAFSSTLSIFLKPITEELGVSRGAFSLIRTFEIGVAAMIVPLLGHIFS